MRIVSTALQFQILCAAGGGGGGGKRAPPPKFYFFFFKNIFIFFFFFFFGFKEDAREYEIIHLKEIVGTLIIKYRGA